MDRLAMHNETDLGFFEHNREEELRALELRWYEGRMLIYVDQILNFVDLHRAEVEELAGGMKSPVLLLHCLKRLIAAKGSIHMQSELKDQVVELKNEIWYRGQKGDYDRARIQAEWALRHARAWRRWRIKEYCFVIDHCAERILEHLRIK